MNKILIFIANLLICIGGADAAIRDGTSTSRTKTASTPSQSRKSSTIVPRGTSAARSGSITQRHNTVPIKSSVTETQRTRTATPNITSRQKKTTTRPHSTKLTRAAQDQTSLISQTRTGAAYEQCKNTYFACMDQFCTLKNDDYRRCSCNNRVFELADVRDVLQQADEKLTVFTENLDVVGMTAAQAASMRTESQGEAALTDDTSASKALLQAIMNSIRGNDSNVSGKYADLNSISISFDTTNAFGTIDAGQAIAAYNGDALYNAVYPQCRNAVREDCNDESLQRAITAYLMAIEQDCNTVQTAIERTQKQMKAAVREGGAMLDLARIENRQKHNSSDITTCINEVESAILSEEVCGANYHKCLDNGEYVDISTGKPIIGVKDFFKLGQLLAFDQSIEAAHQQLAENPRNRTFVLNFESRVKKFAAPALDKCVEDADAVWHDYLNKAMLAIYYAQQSKVSEVQQTCFDYISTCYTDNTQSISSVTSTLTNEAQTILHPNSLMLTSAMCTDYVNSCNNMFDNNIISQYIENVEDTDILTACRAVVRQCFDRYGGTNYENFYYPYSGLFAANSETAPDWFSLYEHSLEPIEGKDGKITYNHSKDFKSECAKVLLDIPSCSAPEMIEAAFGGFDTIKSFIVDSDNIQKHYLAPGAQEADTKFGQCLYTSYGLLEQPDYDISTLGDIILPDGCDSVQIAQTKTWQLNQRKLRPTGVATEVYNNIISILHTQCSNLGGRFVEKHNIKPSDYASDNMCTIQTTGTSSYTSLASAYNFLQDEDMCPRDYELSVATRSWGTCLCWENGGRRSNNGTSAKCTETIPNGDEWEQMKIRDGQVCPNEECVIDPLLPKSI